MPQAREKTISQGKQRGELPHSSSFASHNTFFLLVEMIGGKKKYNSAPFPIHLKIKIVILTFSHASMSFLGGKFDAPSW